MIKRLVFCLALLPAALPAVAQGNDSDRRLELAIELLALLDMDKLTESMHAQMQSMFETQFNEMAACEAAEPVIKEFSAAVSEIAGESISNEQMLPQMAQIYVEVFTEQDLAELVAFYKSPLGQKMLERLPELTQRSMAMAEQQMQGAMPKIMEVSEKFAGRIQQATAECRERQAD